MLRKLPCVQGFAERNSMNNYYNLYMRCLNHFLPWLQNVFGVHEDKKEMTSIQKQLFIVAGVFGVLILILILLVLALAVAVARLANQLKVSIILVL